MSLVLLVCAPLAAQSSKIVKEGADHIPGQYIVVFDDDVLPEQVPELARQLSAQHGAELKRVWTAAVKGFFAFMPEARAEAMSRSPHVKFVEENAPMYFSGSGSMNTFVDPSSCDPTVSTCTAMTDNRLWHLDRADSNYPDPNNSYNYCTDGTGVTVYVVDEGVVGAHQEFGGRVRTGYNATGDAITGDRMPANDPCLGFATPVDPSGLYSNFDQNYYDLQWQGPGHGTAVASAVGGKRTGVAKNVTIVPVKIARCDQYRARYRVSNHFYHQNETMFIVDTSGRFLRGLYRAQNDGTSENYPLDDTTRISAAYINSWPIGTGTQRPTRQDGGVTWELVPEVEWQNAGTIDMLIDGLNWILNNTDSSYPKSYAVVTLSTYRVRVELPASKVTAVETAIRSLLNNNLTVIASANNQNSDACDTTPGRLSRGNPDPAVASKVITAGGTMIVNRPWSVNLAEPPAHDPNATEANGAGKGTELSFDSTKGVREARWICGRGDADNCSNPTPTSSPALSASDSYTGYTGGSNGGQCVTLFAPAKNLFLASNVASNAYRDARLSGGFASGTSWSAPIVAGFAARLMEANGNLTPDGVYTKMLENVTADLISEPPDYPLDPKDSAGNTITGTPNKVLRLADVKINTPPQSTPLVVGNTTNFSVAASGTTTLSYQWYQVRNTFDTATYQRGAHPTDSSFAVGTNSSTLNITLTSPAAFWVRASNSCGSVDSDIVFATDAPPTPVISTPSCNGLTCTFDSSSSTDDQGIASRSWDFGDGTTGSGTTVTHTYAAGGTYTVKLTVTDTTGLSAFTTTSVTVTGVAPPPPANVVATASGANVTITWSAAQGADGYYVERKVSSGSWQSVGTVNGGNTLSIPDTPPASDNGVVLYHVQSRAGTIFSTASNSDVAFVGTFSDDPIYTGPSIYTAVRAEHITQVRSAVNGLLDLTAHGAIYSAAALDPNNLRGQSIDHNDFVTLMTNLNTARGYAGLPSTGFRTTPATNVKISATQMEDLRNGVK